MDSIIGQKLSVRDAEIMVRNHKRNVTDASPATPTIPSLFEKYAKELETTLPFKHKIKVKSIEISLTNEKDIKNFLIFLKKH